MTGCRALIWEFCLGECCFCLLSVARSFQSVGRASEVQKVPDDPRLLRGLLYEMFFAPASGADWACNTLQELLLPGLSSNARGKHSQACSAERVGSTPEVVIIEALSLGSEWSSAMQSSVGDPLASPASLWAQAAGCRKLCTWKPFGQLSEMVQSCVRCSLAKCCRDHPRRQHQCAASLGQVV